MQTANKKTLCNKMLHSSEALGSQKILHLYIFQYFENLNWMKVVKCGFENKRLFHITTKKWE